MIQIKRVSPTYFQLIIVTINSTTKHQLLYTSYLAQVQGAFSVFSFSGHHHRCDHVSMPFITVLEKSFDMYVLAVATCLMFYSGPQRSNGILFIEVQRHFNTSGTVTSLVITMISVGLTITCMYSIQHFYLTIMHLLWLNGALSKGISSYQLHL